MRPSSTLRFWRRWTWLSLRATSFVALWRGRPRVASFIVWCTFPIAVVVSVVAHAVAVVVVDAIISGVPCPWGLTPRGRTGKLRWTRRLYTVAVLGTLISALLVALGTLVANPWLFGALAVWTRTRRPRGGRVVARPLRTAPGRRVRRPGAPATHPRATQWSSRLRAPTERPRPRTIWPTC